MPNEQDNQPITPRVELDHVTQPQTIPTRMEESRATTSLVRGILLAYFFLIVYASWYPFVGWNLTRVTTLPNLLTEWPRYFDRFDLVTNVLAYIPFTALIVMALYTQIRSWKAWVIATLVGCLMSLCAECIQIFLPTRVVSLTDLITNCFGSLLGATVGVLVSPWLFRSNRLAPVRQRWIYHEGGHFPNQEIILLALWPAANIYPQAYAFGLGQILPALSQWINEGLDLDWDIAAWLMQDFEVGAAEYLLAESVITACGVAGAMLMFSSILKRQAPRLFLFSGLIIAALAMKSLAYAVLFEPDMAWTWLTPGSKSGLFVGFLMLYGFSYTPFHVQKRLAALLLLLSLIVANLFAENPYFLATMQTWVQGKFITFNGAAQFLTLFWPFFSLAVLLRNKSPK